jgi:hypothetical protein
MPAPSAQFGSSTSLGKKELHDWTMPQSLKLRFSQRFNQLDKNRVGLLNGAQARGVLDERFGCLFKWYLYLFDFKF